MLTPLKNVTFYTIVFCSLTIPAHPARMNKEEAYEKAEHQAQSAARGAAIISGVGLGISSAAATYGLLQLDTFDKIELTKSEGAKVITSLLTGLAVGTGSGVLTKNLVYSSAFASTLEDLLSQLPPACFSRTSSRIANIAADSLLERTFEQPSSLISHINGRFCSNWPLIKGREHLASLKQQLESCKNSLSNIAHDAAPYDEYQHLIEKCNELRPQVIVMLDSIDQMVNLVMQHPEYTQQNLAYQAHLEAERQRQLQREMLEKQQRHEREMERQRQLAQQQAQQSALAHDAYQREKDRQQTHPVIVTTPVTPAPVINIQTQPITPLVQPAQVPQTPVQTITQPAPKPVQPTASLTNTQPLANFADQECAICLEDYKAGDQLDVLSCGGKHTYHSDCINEWICSGHNTCPLCQAQNITIANQVIIS
ncbi:MAG: hypothetical protein H6679_01810 [Epsilonproteobacteria bacterium]|nr:hypothetical protein [Campylobacterota bacterium]